MSLQNIKLNISNVKRQDFYNQNKISDPFYYQKPITTTYKVLQQEWLYLLERLDNKKIQQAGWELKEDFINEGNIIPITHSPEIIIEDNSQSIHVDSTYQTNINYISQSNFVNDDIYALVQAQRNNRYWSGLFKTADFFQNSSFSAQLNLASNFVANQEYWLQYYRPIYASDIETAIEADYYGHFVVFQQELYFLYVKFSSVYSVQNNANYLRFSVILFPESAINSQGQIVWGYKYNYDFPQVAETLVSDYNVWINSINLHNSLLGIWLQLKIDTDYKDVLFQVPLDTTSKQQYQTIWEHSASWSGYTELVYNSIDFEGSEEGLYYIFNADSDSYKIYQISSHSSSYTTVNINDIYLDTDTWKTLILNEHLYLYGQYQTKYKIYLIDDVTSLSISPVSFPQSQTTNNSNILGLVPYQNNLLGVFYSTESINNVEPTENNNIALTILNKDTLAFLPISPEYDIDVYWTGSQFENPVYSSQSNWYVLAKDADIILGSKKNGANTTFYMSHIKNELPGIIETVDNPLAYAYIDLYHNTGKELRIGFCFNLPANSDTTNNTIYDNIGRPIYYNNFFISYSENELKDIGEETTIAYNFANSNQFNLSNFSDMPATQGIFAWEIKNWLQQDSAGEELTGLPSIQYTLSLDSSGDYVNVFIGGYYQPRIYALGNLMVGKVLKNGTRALMNFGQPKFDIGTEESPKNPWVIDRTVPFGWYLLKDNTNHSKYSLFIIDLTIGNEVIPCGGSFSILDKYSESHSGQIIVRPIKLLGSNTNILRPLSAYNLLFPIQISVSSYNDNYVKNGKDTGIIDILNPEYCCIYDSGGQDNNPQGFLLDSGKYIICEVGARLPIVKWEPNLPASDNPFNPMV